MSKKETKVCKHCQSEIPAKAKVCPHCRKKQKGGFFKWLLILLVIVVIIGVISGEDDADQKSTSSNQGTSNQSEQVETEPEYIKITSTELIDAFNNNQVKCKQLYDDQLLEVTGKVKSIGTDILDQTYICLDHDTELAIVGIQCYTANKDTIAKISELQEGDTVTVRGKGDCGSMSFSLEKIEIVE